MNSTFNTTAYTLSTVLLFLNYKKTFEKAVMLGGFINVQNLYI